jgi:hypothetical protein
LTFSADRKNISSSSSFQIMGKLGEYASDHDIPAHTLLNHEAVTVKEEKQGRYTVVVRDLANNTLRSFTSQFLCVTCGILSTQWSAEERGVKDVKKFKGVVTYGGRHAGQDSAVSRTDLTGKRVVIMGSGSFAAEALEAAERSGAEHITIVGRPRYRWILPFSRQYTISTIANAPMLPWSWKTSFALWYLRKYFYAPCGLSHWAPQTYKVEEMEFSGQCNDGYFRLSHNGKLTTKIDGVDRLDAKEVVLKSGERLPCDMFVVASGCRYNLEPNFLKEMNLGFKDMHNFAFIGPNPRIGCASDFVFAYVPFGPIKQLEMYFHSVDACRQGKEEEVRQALFATPLPNHGEGMHKGGRMAGHYTFFEYNHWYSQLSKAQEARVQSMFKILDVNRGFWGRVGTRVGALAANWIGWLGTAKLAMLELWRYPVFGKGVQDHHFKPKHALLHASTGAVPVSPNSGAGKAAQLAAAKAASAPAVAVAFPSNSKKQKKAN